MIDLEELKRKAKAATPGPWMACLGSGNHECTAIHWEGNEQHPFGIFVCDLMPDWIMDDKYKQDREYKSANMAYLEAANHSAILRLLEAYEVLRDAAQGGRECGKCWPCQTICTNALAKAEAIMKGEK